MNHQFWHLFWLVTAAALMILCVVQSYQLYDDMFALKDAREALSRTRGLIDGADKAVNDAAALLKACRERKS